MSEDDPFLAEAQRRGLLTTAQAEDCRRILQALSEVQVELSIDEIAARKGFVTAPQGAEIRRALARLRVGRYEVIERVGEGAAGVVWKARDTKLDRIVALKVLSQKAQSTPAFRERFLREARIAVTLNHVNIVRGLDYGEADGYQYFAMEFVEGENAEQRLAHVGRIPERDAAAIALDVVHALGYVQKFQIVHRDIKPGNLLLTPTGHVKVGDLGLAKPMLLESELLAGDGGTAGTPFYMSPEQIREPEKVDWRSDVYSLGATLYHLLTGVPVFRPDDKLGVIQKHLKEKPRNPREHVLELSDGMASVVMRMLQKHPEDRYGALDELAGDLESVLAGRQPLHTAPPLPPVEATAERHARVAVARRITEKHLPRERFPTFGLAAFALFAVALVAVGMTLYGDKPKTPAETATAKPPEPVVKPPIQTNPPPVETTQPTKPVPSKGDPVVDLVLANNARSEAERRIARAKELVANGSKFEAVVGELTAFPEKYRQTPAQKLIDDEIVRLNDITFRGRFESVVKAAKALARRGRGADAIEMIHKDAETIETPWAVPESKEALRDIAEIANSFERSREEQAGKFANIYGRALLLVGRDGTQAARILLDREKASVDAYDDEVSALKEDLDLFEQFPDPEVIDNHKERGATALLLWCLASGDVERAEGTIDAVRTSGGDVDEAKARVDRVRGVLIADATVKLALAETRRASGNLDEAAHLTKEIVRLLPTFGPARVLEARILFERNDFVHAAEVLEQALRQRDAPAEAHLWMGEVLARASENLRAEAELRRFLDLAEKSDPLRTRAEALRSEVHSRRVKEDVKQWRDIAKSAKSTARTKKNDVAEVAWGRVVELLPDDVEALLALGEVYCQKEMFSHAFAVYSTASKLPSLDARSRKAIDLQLAKPQLKGKGYQSGDGQRLAEGAETYFQREDWGRAVQGFQSALAFAPYLETARLHLVRALLARAHEAEEGDPGRTADASEAVANADTLLRLYFDEATPPALRSDATPLALRSDAKLLLGDVGKARDDADLATRIDAKNVLAQLALGRALLAAGTWIRALEVFREANRLEPSPQALLGIAHCYVFDLNKEGNREGARAALDNFRQLYGVPRAFNPEYTELMKALERK